MPSIHATLQMVNVHPWGRFQFCAGQMLSTANTNLAAILHHVFSSCTTTKPQLDRRPAVIARCNHFFNDRSVFASVCDCTWKPTDFVGVDMIVAAGGVGGGSEANMVQRAGLTLRPPPLLDKAMGSDGCTIAGYTCIGP
jgi:hypothetical protein